MIPGVSDPYNTKGIIDKIMKLDSAPVDRMKASVETYKKQKTVWGELSTKMKELSDSALKLYSFQNPFEERKATSSNPQVLTATSSRGAPERTSNIVVQQLAGSDKFLSNDLPLKYQVPSGKYVIKVGKDEQSFQFRGGRLSDLADAINKNAGTLVNAQIVQNTMDTQVLVIASLKTGSQNHLSFSGEAEKFAVDAGIMARSITDSRDVSITPTAVSSWTRPLDPLTVSISAGTLTLSPGSEASLPVSPTMAITPQMVLSLEIQVKFLGGAAYVPPSPPSGPSINAPGAVTLNGVTIQDNPSQSPLPQWTPPPPPPVVEDHAILFAQNGSTAVPLPDVADTNGFTELTIPLAKYVKAVTAIDLRNRNTQREVSVRNVRIYDPNSRGGYSPLHPVTQARDAKLMIDGVEALRDSNTISDLVPKTTLTLLSASPAPVTLNVAPDDTLVKNAIIDFVGRYNQLLTKINILTSNSQTVIDEVSYFTPAQKQQAQDELGMFQGDMTFSILKSKLEDTMMSPFPTDLGPQLALLAQIGISTNASPGGTQGFDVSRLRGYLEIDEQRLDSSLQAHFRDIKQLFGTDTTGDLIINNGAAYRVHEIISPYVQIGGIVASRVQSIDQQISQTNKQITDMNSQLAQKRSNLQSQYAQMEGTLGQLQHQSQALGNFGMQSTSGSPSGP